jgi:hypothetical protein
VNRSTAANQKTLDVARSDAIGGGIVRVEQATDPLGMDASRRDPGSGIPTQLLASFRLWLLAVAAGVLETALVVVDATDGEVGSAAQVAVGVAVRLLVFTAAVYLAIQLRQGRNWARVALAVLLGGIGTGSLVVGPVTWLAEGGSLADAVAAAELGSVLFAAGRVVHLGAVIAALILMFHPAANAYLRATTRAPAGAERSRTGTAQPDD